MKTRFLKPMLNQRKLKIFMGNFLTSHHRVAAPSDYVFFMHLKQWLGEQYFKTNQELTNAVVNSFISEAASFYAEGLKKLVLDHEKCLEFNDGEVGLLVNKYAIKIILIRNRFLIIITYFITKPYIHFEHASYFWRSNYKSEACICTC